MTRRGSPSGLLEAVTSAMALAGILSVVGWAGSSTADATAARSPLPSPARGVDPGAFAWFEIVGEQDQPTLLCVGRYDGRVFEALRTPVDTRLRGAGPRDGLVLAWWREGAESVLVLVDTATGSSRELVRSDRAITSAAFGLGTSYYYNLSDEQGQDLWLADLASDGPAPRRVARGSNSRTSALKAAVDRGSILLTDIDESAADDRRASFRVLDTTDQEVRRVRGRAFEPVGLLGDDVIVWSRHQMGSITFPLRAIAPDGSARLIVDQEGTFATIVADVDGSPMLAFEGQDDAGHYTLSGIGPGTEALPSLLYNGEYPLFEPPIQMLWNDEIHGIESPGYVALMPDSMAFKTRGENLEHVPPGRLLVSLGDGDDIDLGVQPLGPTRDSGDSGHGNLPVGGHGTPR